VLQSTYFNQVDNKNDFNPSTWSLLVQKPTQPPPVQYTLTIQPSDGQGLTNPVSGSYKYNQTTTISVQANPSNSWVFDHWVLDGTSVGNVNPYNVVMNVDHTIKAVFIVKSDTSSGVPGYPFRSILFGLIISFALIIYKREHVIRS
jgi:hypothetical protein